MRVKRSFVHTHAPEVAFLAAVLGGQKRCGQPCSTAPPPAAARPGPAVPRRPLPATSHKVECKALRAQRCALITTRAAPKRGSESKFKLLRSSSFLFLFFFLIITLISRRENYLRLRRTAASTALRLRLVKSIYTVMQKSLIAHPGMRRAAAAEPGSGTGSRTGRHTGRGRRPPPRRALRCSIAVPSPVSHLGRALPGAAAFLASPLPLQDGRAVPGAAVSRAGQNVANRDGAIRG